MFFIFFYSLFFFFFFFNDTATTEIYTLSLHDALPISGGDAARFGRRPASRARNSRTAPHPPAEHRPFTRHLDADRHDAGDGSQARFVEAEESRRLASQPVGSELRRGFAVQVQAERVAERQPATRRPGRELDPPGASDAVHTQQGQ